MHACTHLPCPIEGPRPRPAAAHRARPSNTCFCLHGSVAGAMPLPGPRYLIAYSLAQKRDLTSRFQLESLIPATRPAPFVFSSNLRKTPEFETVKTHLYCTGRVERAQGGPKVRGDVVAGLALVLETWRWRCSLTFHNFQRGFGSRTPDSRLIRFSESMPSLTARAFGCN